MKTRLVSDYLDPQVHPDYGRRPFSAPTWTTFENRPQFLSLREFRIKNQRNVRWREDLEIYTEKFHLGRMVWLFLPATQTDNFAELVDEIKQRRLYLVDIWGLAGSGYITGSGYDDDSWMPLFTGTLVSRLRAELGERFLGVDNGENDGAYVWLFVDRQSPVPHDRFLQYLNFHRFFQLFGEERANHMCLLTTLQFSHYLAKEGNHILLGAEAAQHLPNAQIYYCFHRGAGKQYGLLWWSMVSIFNHFGYKGYQGETEIACYRYGPDEGTSLNLMRRLIYSQYLYNSCALGFERELIVRGITTDFSQTLPQQWPDDLYEVSLTPIGRLQRTCHEFVDRHGRPGVMQTPVALLFDFFAGWVAPRTFVRENPWQVWGVLPYQSPDYFAHHVLSMLYPGYEDSAYYHDERGFLAPTPYGDILDCLLSDATAPVLGQYSLIISVGALHIDDELRDKLNSFVENGGHLVLTANDARQWRPEWRIGAPRSHSAATTVRLACGSTAPEPQAFSLCPVELPDDAVVIARCGAEPAAFVVRQGCGRATILLAPHGVSDEPIHRQPINAHETIDAPLACPYLLLEHVRSIIDEALCAARLFTAGPDLSVITCRKSPGHYTVGVHNNDLCAHSLALQSHIGRIEALRELELDQACKSAPGYWPTGRADNDGGVSDKANIAGGDIRLFDIRIAESETEALPSIAHHLRPRRRALTLRNIADIKRALLAQPTFFQHFDSVKIDWRHLWERSRESLLRDAAWFELQQVRFVVDFSSGVNIYPDLCLLKEPQLRSNETLFVLENVFTKMRDLKMRDAIFCLHQRHNANAETVDRDCREMLHELANQAEARGIILHIQHHPAKWRPTARATLELIRAVRRENLKFAGNAAHAAMTGESLTDTVAAAGEYLDIVLLSAPCRDEFGREFPAHLPLHQAERPVALEAVLAADVAIVLDGVYRDWNEVYRDLRILRKTGK